MRVTRFALPLVLLAAVVAPAAAACRDDLVTVSQTVERTRASLQGAAANAKCAAYREHIAAMGQVRDVFARCDKGDNKGKNAAQVKANIADLTRQMRASCKS